MTNSSYVARSHLDQNITL